MRPEEQGPKTFNQVLLDELRKLRPNLAALRKLRAEPLEEPANPDLNEFARGENLRRIYRAISELDEKNQLSALCLSGGGIRSATFNLGVLQSLARLGLIDRFDYLSTVSGGGYIGGWLKAWMARAGTARVCNELANETPDLPLKPEPRPVDRLREFSNYLTPRRGLLSGDTWAAAAIVVRNLLLNWSVVVPVLMCFVGAPQLYVLAIQVNPGPWGVPTACGMAVTLGLLASIAVHRFRHPPHPPGTEPGKVLLWAVLPLVLAALALSVGGAWVHSNEIPALHLIVFAILWCILLPLFGWALREPFWLLAREGRWPVRELVALVGSGIAGAVLLIWAVTEAQPFLVERPVLFAILAVPLLLAIYLAARTLFVAFSAGQAPRGQRDAVVTTGRWEDADREWWGRFSGYVLMAAIVWGVTSTIALVGWHLVLSYGGGQGMSLVSAMGGISGIVTVLLGKGAGTGSGRGTGTKPAGSGWQNWVLAGAAPLFCIAVLVLLAHANVLVLRWLTDNPALFDMSAGLARSAAPVPAAALLGFGAMLSALLLLGWLAGLVVNVNLFSLHGFYRNRLVRAYLGASNSCRCPDPFTGFALNDNLPLCDLWKEPAGAADISSQRPLLVVNTTLNLVRGARLAWQERKAESFSMSSFYCGNFYEGYRPARDYGYRNGGISLGTALTISGAAANPNMGYHSSPAITFVLGLLNARLGAWLGNTNVHGEHTYGDPGPRSALALLLVELLGWTSNSKKYVQLSDGGHFDNLGLYEMVLRRCRLIVVSDAGRDPESGFEDLGNAIRKIRIDFGVPVVFKDSIKIVPRTEKTPGLYCAVGEILYEEVDGCGKDGNGTLIYLKPTLNGDGATLPYDIYSYSRTANGFPHESTADQWFDESQFESYRALGRHTFDQMVAGARQRITSLEDLATVVRDYAKRTPAQPASAAAPRPAEVPL